MKKTIYLTLLILISSIHCNSQLVNQKLKVKNITIISNEYKLGFLEYNNNFSLYKKPIIIVAKKKYKILGYDNSNFSDGNIIGISPNKKYIVLDYIIKGYANDGINKEMHENYLCVIIDLNQHKVVLQMQSDCGGEWNEQNQWVNNNKIIFNP